MKPALFLATMASLSLLGCGASRHADNRVDTDQANSTAPHDHERHAGMAMEGARRGAPTMRLALAPAGPFVPGQSRHVTLTLVDIASGKPMGPDDLASVHTRRLHLLIIDASLSDYQHIHPTAGPANAGTWQFDFAPRFARAYRVWADVTWLNGDHEYVGGELVAGSQAAPAPTAAAVLTARADGLAFRLSFPGPLKVGEAVEGNIAIADATTGKPFAGLQPIMGAFGHIVAFAGDWNSIEHVHPLGVEPTTDSARSGPTIRFHLQPEKAGVLKLFAQIEANGRETIVPFTTSVLP